jgi:uncharacterized protein YegL
MAGMEKDTIGGFNSMIEKQRGVEGMVYVSTVLFSGGSVVLHDRKPIEEIKPLTEKDYEPSGCTALLDALGEAIKHIGNIHKYARKEDIPERTMFVITTDGEENASRKYTSQQIKELISNQKEKYGWEFLFLAANIDAVETAGNIGISADRAVNYSVSQDTMAIYEEVGKTICECRMYGEAPSRGWARQMENNLKKRRNNKKRS